MLVAQALVLKRSLAPHQGLVESQREDIRDPCAVGVDERLAPAAHRRVDRVPTASQL